MTTETTPAAKRKQFVGTVKSSAMNKSIVVDIVTPKPDRLYKKYVKHTKRVMVHDEANSAHPGDRVSIVECRPVSKKKRFRLVQVIERSKSIRETEAAR